MAISEIYVDPAIAGDSGTGTIGDPFGDLEYAIKQTIFDTTNGTRVNIKAGTDEILASTLTAAMADTGTTVAWVPTAQAPAVFQGYTSAAGDGGIGGIDINDQTVTTGSTGFLHFIDLHMHNTNSASDALSLGGNCSVVGCEINDIAGIAVDTSTFCFVSHNYLHDVGGASGIRVQSGVVSYNVLINGTKSFGQAINSGGSGTYVSRNIIKVSGTSEGIRCGNRASLVNNSIWSTSGTGAGIRSDSNAYLQEVLNNLVEGFSGSGGIGIDLDTAGTSVVAYGGNAVYNCETAYTAPAYYSLDTLGVANETLSASPFTDAANNDFSPVDTGGVKEGSAPQALQAV